MRFWSYFFIFMTTCVLQAGVGVRDTRWKPDDWNRVPRESHKSFSGSSFGTKTFSTSENTQLKTVRMQEYQGTKAVSGLKTVTLKEGASDLSRSANGMDMEAPETTRGFAGRDAYDSGKTFAEGDRSLSLKNDTFETDDYKGPEAQKVRKSLNTTLPPNLTVEEVKDLLNRNQKPVREE